MLFAMNHIGTVFIGVVIFINLIFVFAMIFVERHDTSVTLAWILTFLFIPILGLLFYYFFGSTAKLKMLSKKREHFRAEKIYRSLTRRQALDLQLNKLEFNDPKAKYYKDMILFNAKNAQSYYTQDNQVDLLVTADAKFDKMFEDIKNAKESINVLYFIIMSRDQIAQKLISLLTQKVKEGVEVRIIYDMFGFLKLRVKDYDAFKEAGGIVYRYLPTLFRSALYVNYRMHRKMVIIDGEIAYTGGFNVGDEYFGLNPKKTPWRDTSIRLTGSSVIALQIQFLQDFFMLDMYYGKRRKGKSPYMDDTKINSMLKAPKNTGNMGVQIVSSGPDTKNPCVKDAYVKMISNAKKYCFIQTPYFIPDQTIMESLRLAALSGVDVRIMLPGIPDKTYVYYITLSNIEQLLKSGIKVYLHRGFLHAKMLVSDDFIATVGTANMDIRSFLLDYEVNAFVYNETFAKNCRDAFIQDLKDCKILKLHEYKKRRMWQKTCESVCRLISPLA